MVSLLFLFAFRVTLAQADSACVERDFRNALGTPRMQDGTSWCYANSAADLITQSIGQKTSAIDLATTFLLADEKKLENLKNDSVRSYLLHHPDFAARLLDTRMEDDAYKPERILSTDGILDAGGKDDEAILMSNLKGLCLSSRLPAGEENLNKYLEAIRDDYLNEKDPAFPSGPIGAVENDMAKIMARTFQNWVDMKCGKRIRPKHALLPYEVAVADNLDEFKNLLSTGKLDPVNARSILQTELDRVLDAGKVAAIAYESYDLYPLSAGRAGSSHGDHSSVVAARKKIDGQCYYFVRNHFGPTCGYRPELEKRCEKDNGGVWVTMETLKHLYSVISIR
jgi:hypothetical protein